MDITVQQARSFLAVAEELNFTRAAERLHVSPSSLSELITTLERRLRRRLFRRTSRRVELTEAGLELRPLARQLIEAADRLRDWATATSAVTVRLGLTVSSARFGDLLAAVTRGRPDVDWRVRHLPFSKAGAALTGSEVDCLFTTDRVPGGEIEAIPVWSEEPVVVLSADHRLASRPALTVDDLAGETIITAEDTAASERWLADVRPGGAAPATLPAAATLDDILDLCAAGRGINIAGGAASEMYGRQGICYIPLRGAAPRTTYLCLRKGPRSPELAYLIRTATAGVL